MGSRVKMLFSVLLCVSVMTLSGCSKKVTTDEGLTSETDSEALGAEESLDSKPLGISEGRTTEGMLPVYFNFDSSEIKTDRSCLQRMPWSGNAVGLKGCLQQRWLISPDIWSW